jgi:hypothetical protein
MRRVTLVFLAVILLGCPVAALIPAIIPLVNTIAEYFVGETTETQFLEDLTNADIEDPLEILKVFTNQSEPKPKTTYVMGDEDSTEVVSLTFRSDTLRTLKWKDTKKDTAR